MSATAAMHDLTMAGCQEGQGKPIPPAGPCWTLLAAGSRPGQDAMPLPPGLQSAALDGLNGLNGLDRLDRHWTPCLGGGETGAARIRPQLGQGLTGEALWILPRNQHRRDVPIVPLAQAIATAAPPCSCLAQPGHSAVR